MFKETNRPQVSRIRLLLTAAILISASLAGTAVAGRFQLQDLTTADGQVLVLPDTGPTVVYATNSVKCGNTVYEVSTGTKGGSCDATRVPGQPTTGTNCVDGGNAAEANCTTGCGTTSGSGSCKITVYAE